MKKSQKPFVFGLAGSITLLLIYFSILIFANSFGHAIKQFTQMWYWILVLVVGFGIQVGLYSHIRISMREKITGATAEVATAGGISTGSMIACCAHHITDVLPIIGLSAAALFLVKYQIPFIILGIFSNLVGITMMLNIIQKHRLFDKEGLFKRLFKYDMKLVRNITVVLSVIVVLAVFIAATINTETVNGVASYNSGRNSSNKQLNLPTKTNDENGVSIEVKPIDFSFDKQVKFDIAINTHQGSLDFDLIEISVLEDDKGNKYKPINWEGSPSGGHHRYGTLTFSKIGEKTTFIKLIIKNVYDVPERIFVWNVI